MILNYFNTGFFAAVVLASAVYNLKVNTRDLNSRRMLTQIVQNISRVQNVLERFIKHFEKVEGNAEEYSDITAEVVSEVKDIFKIEKPAKTLHKLQNSKKVETRKHGSNNDEIDNNSEIFEFRTEVRDFTMNTSRNDSADDIVRGHRRVNENLNDEIQFVPVDLSKKNKNTSDAFTRETMPTTSDQAQETTYKFEISTPHESSLEEEKIAQDEILKAKWLRQSYDEACKTVIKKKCKRALDTVLKDVCNPAKRKCAGKFKSDFKAYGKTGCDTQFNEKSAMCRMGHDDPEFGGTAEVSDPYINDNDKELLRAKIEQYQKACNKADYKKCLAACKYAVDETCGENECVKSKQKAFDKSCQRRCKENYQIADSDTSSDTISDSGSSAGWDSV